jgi:voltage-gated potassium channel
VQDSFRRRVYLALNPERKPRGISLVLIILILVSTIVAIVETEDMMRSGRERVFFTLEMAFAAVFTIEYVFRIWSAPEGPRSRLRYALMPSSIVDLIVVIASLIPLVGSNVVALRMLRVLRMLRLAKLGRFSRALGTLHRAILSRASHLLATLAMAVVFLLFAATLTYWIEGAGQPDRFGSIPRALWWAAVTMTTVGYGDVIPLTPLGKLIAVITSMGGIVLIAIPTGILAASFSDELMREEEIAEAEAGQQA